MSPASPTPSKNLRSAIWLRSANGWLTLFWLGMIPISLLTGLKHSLPYIVGLSVYALMVGHFSTWVAGRAEVASELNPAPED